MNLNRLVQHIGQAERILDIGANTGQFSLDVKKHLPGCEFNLVEANPYCEPFLAKLPFKYVIKGLTRYGETKSLFFQKDFPIGSGASFYKENTHYYAEGSYETISLETDTLDNLNFYPDKVVDLVKIDVQGSELDIIKGGNKTLERTKFLLLECSVMPYNLNAPLIDKVIEHVNSLNFQIKDILGYIYDIHGRNIIQLDILFFNTQI